MKVYLHEIKEHDLEYQFDESTPWVMEMVGSLDERMDQISRPNGWRPRSRPTQIQMTLRRVDDLVHASGKVNTQLYLLCSLCAEAFVFPIQKNFHTLLTQTETYSEAPRETSRKGAYEGNPLHEDDSEQDDDDAELGAPMDLESSDFEITLLKENFIDLKELIHEQLVLTLPIQPKPPAKDDGECNKCGKNQFEMLPTVHQNPLKENPFQVLKNFKPKGTQ